MPYPAHPQVSSIAHDDSVDAESARSLLRWALAGQVPYQYRRYATPQGLLDKKDAARYAALARDLRAGLYGEDLVGFGGVLVTLGSPSAQDEEAHNSAWPEP